MKGLDMSLGIDVSHGDFQIATSEGNLGNAQLPLQMGAAS